MWTTGEFENYNRGYESFSHRESLLLWVENSIKCSLIKSA
jgi:hypothetical protein